MGNYVTTDHTGRALQNLLVDHYVVTYWADHAAREVRLVEVASV